MLATLSLLAQQAPPQQGPGGSSQMLITMVLFFVIFWVLIIRPQRKKQKEDEARRAALKKGDRIVTIAGIHGVVNAISDRTISVRVADNIHITMEKSAVATVLPKEGEAAAAVAEIAKKD